MVYVLGHKPHEFGLVPEHAGFVTYKELLWAIHEEPGWGYVKQGHINEVLLGKDRALFHSEESRIRALDRRWHLNLENPSQSLAKILFTPVRRKAHPHVMEKGLSSNHGKYIVLSPDRDMANRIGRRRDQVPVLLEIMASAAQKEGIMFYSFGDLFLTFQIPAKYIVGPPVAKEDVKTAVEKPVKRQKAQPAFEPGTFVLDVNRDPDPHRRAKAKKQRGWKEEARKMRRRGKS